jgi:hypothetical protein
MGGFSLPSVAGQQPISLGTLKGLAPHSAPAPRPATPALRAASPNPPALWLRRAEPVYAYAIMGTMS